MVKQPLSLLHNIDLFVYYNNYSMDIVPSYHIQYDDLILNPPTVHDIHIHDYILITKTKLNRSIFRKSYRFDLSLSYNNEVQLYKDEFLIRMNVYSFHIDYKIILDYFHILHKNYSSKYFHSNQNKLHKSPRFRSNTK